jgi:hypothetical protein
MHTYIPYVHINIQAQKIFGTDPTFTKTLVHQGILEAEAARNGVSLDDASLDNPSETRQVCFDTIFYVYIHSIHQTYMSCTEFQMARQLNSHVAFGSTKVTDFHAADCERGRSGHGLRPISSVSGLCVCLCVCVCVCVCGQSVSACVRMCACHGVWCSNGGKCSCMRVS